VEGQDEVRHGPLSSAVDLDPDDLRERDGQDRLVVPGAVELDAVVGNQSTIEPRSSCAREVRSAME
jgi:hypothetical protein